MVNSTLPSGYKREPEELAEAVPQAQACKPKFVGFDAMPTLRAVRKLDGHARLEIWKAAHHDES